MINGTGSPPIGPIDIVIEGNRITEVKSVGYPGVSINENRRPKKGDFEIDASSHYLLPGFVDMHAHAGSAQKHQKQIMFISFGLAWRDDCPR